MNIEQTDKLINALKCIASNASGRWFNFEIDNESGKVYYAEECSLEVLTFDELINRLS